ncbi:acetyltransferase (GNAT) family protein [Georgenia soli]|uniref:Acetyltransferase (GNAT) family protein n=1 Tax=Georgenia soli TaxID=638953 RepID=A0A2A9EJ51_9MICO|nr:GNAT family N-acetyltransferase [Georgenia soli]PFG39107.1 acetyltransferase (GNAT) family protein [Georgenia soli]
MRTEILAVDDGRWPATLDGHLHDVYHLPGYGRLDAGRADEQPVAVVVRDGPWTLFVPLVLAPLPDGLGAGSTWRDARSPYGYATPLVLTATDAGRGPTLAPARDARAETFLSGAIGSLTAALLDMQVVSAFVRLHPLPGFALPQGPLASAGTLAVHGESVWVDLGRGEEELRAQLRTNHRRDLVKLVRGGFTGQVEQGWGALPDLQQIYADTMDRVDAREFYRRSGEFFDRVRDVGAFVVATVRLGGEVVAAGLFSEVSGTVQYFLGGTRREHLARSPSKLLLLTVQNWARERGDRAFVLGSGSGWGGAENPLFRFKLGFSPLRGAVATWRLVADPSRYARLVDASRVPVDADFFPAYRAPGRASTGSAHAV